MFYKREFLFIDFEWTQNEGGGISGWDFTLLPIHDIISSFNTPAPFRESKCFLKGNFCHRFCVDTE